MSVHDRFGLLGLLNVIRMTDPDLNTLALGTDLTSLGLNPNSPEYACSHLLSLTIKQLPICYVRFPLRRRPYTSHAWIFHSTMLLHAVTNAARSHENSVVFWGNIVLYFLLHATWPITSCCCAWAVRELRTARSNLLRSYKRDWRYHKTLKRWFTRIQGADYEKYPTYELGSYFYFEIKVWTKLRKDNFTLVYEDLEEKPPTINYSYVPTPANPPSRIVGSGSVARSWCDTSLCYRMYIIQRCSCKGCLG